MRIAGTTMRVEKVGDKKGIRCSCGVFTEFTMYVCAHSSDVLVFSCECGRSASILDGEILEEPAKDG